MILEGVMQGGRVILDTPANIPDGTRVRIEPILVDNFAPPDEPYERDKELTLLREAYEDVKAGRGVDARTFLKELASQYNLPLEPGE